MTSHLPLMTSLEGKLEFGGEIDKIRDEICLGEWFVIDDLGELVVNLGKKMIGVKRWLPVKK